MCLTFDLFVFLLNYEHLASTKVLYYFFFISRAIVIHLGFRKHEFRLLTLYLLLCIFIGT